MKNIFNKDVLTTDPFRLFFPLGMILIMWGTLLWIPQIWSPSSYPILLHRFLVLNGFTTCFIAGFLMTAAPRFSQSFPASIYEIYCMIFITFLGILFAYFDNVSWVYVCSALQALLLLYFLARRLIKRRANPPYSFLMIPLGFIAWFVSASIGIFNETDLVKQIYYEGVIASIIIGVGSKLIPAILGHQNIILPSNAKMKQDGPVPLLATIPFKFIFIIVLFWLSYFIAAPWGSITRAFTVLYISIVYWRVHQKPLIPTALANCLRWCSIMIVISFFASALWQDGHIHATHQFFISGIVLLCLLVATRVVQAHGAKNPDLEDHKILYWVTVLLILSGATRMSAILWPEIYASHLGYSSILLNIGVFIWGYKFIKYVNYR